MKTTANKGRVLETRVQRSIGQSVVNNNSYFKIRCKKGHGIKLGSFHYNTSNFVRAVFIHGIRLYYANRILNLKYSHKKYYSPIE